MLNLDLRLQSVLDGTDLKVDPMVLMLPSVSVSCYREGNFIKVVNEGKTSTIHEYNFF